MTFDEFDEKFQRAQLDDKLETIIEELGGVLFPCSKKKGGKACTAQYEDKLDRDGRPVFYFATGCEVVDRFCPACRAYWHAAVARNCLRDFTRVAGE